MKQVQQTQTVLSERQQLRTDWAKKIGSVWASEKHKSEMKQLTVFSLLFAGAVAGRVALQFVPSVEPIIPFAVLAGFLFGPKEGFSLGSGAYVASNFFVWGLQGPWTVFQAVGAGVAGVAAGFFGKTKKPSEMDLIWVTVAGTLFFEVVMNSYGALFSMGLFGLGLLTIPLYFLTSLPFSLVHIVSNAAFAKGLGPLLKKWSRKTNELEIVAINRVVGDKRTGIRMYKTR